MPVLSPHRSLSSGLSGSYRYTYNTAFDKPYYGSTSYNPRLSSYSERFTTRTYTDSDGRRVYLRSGSITEDGVTTKFREESREGSSSRDSGINSVREGSALDFPRRDSSLSRSDRVSTSSVIDSVAEMRNKYSPANYVPAIYRNKYENISRSKSINDIGLPPIENKSTNNVSPPKNQDVNTSPSGGGAKGGKSSAGTTGASRRSLVASQPADKDLDDDVAHARRVSPSNKLGLVGLRNIGNTCFMNSVLQCLSNTKVLLDYINKDSYQRDINSTTSAMKGALIKSFAELLKQLWSPSSSGPVNTAALKAQIQKFAPRFMGYAQQDAQEFLRYLLEGLHEEVNRVTSKHKPITTDIDDTLSDTEKANEAWKRYVRTEDSYIVDMFVGQLKSTLKCTFCGHCSVTFDPFWDLSLPLPSGRNSTALRLSHCLDAFTKEETLDGDEKPKCDKCKERRRCTKSFSIQKFPQVLVIHLKRFSPLERFRGKLNTLVEFPVENLDLSRYAADSAQQNGMSSRYNLYAVSEHSGTPYSGHYTAHCKNPLSGEWHEYNDSRVSLASARSAVSPEAYVLFYEREGESPSQNSL
ncbi:ubiquitin carboxyl-terminal hydrolase 2-like [Sitophilus oryzae]|uniref:Ubiquitin carboxyl-terminal hydrolase n=1 Tax=Sitophilus oryzae TaxID=7048 RepID=A0A6J2YJC5_SITOR|nr:ubiquitin carboxyl-terminal hydrolase 2-like [Sitophilus oryzae]XP_030764068.1 ubiquitin carboxyl-terminal hydrolase 2-like [Sitophilus oryzae]XP_030764133.1 ubiquitin carboxyl-terminal hydrolase 2-like [Sitophilus oryzae]XP_030764208.1 ubiquitin carboxyl-terminal hydrolase 2-like [Sitophilus oryzae]